MPLARSPPLWQVDAALRPEGKDGPLVRNVAAHKAYYERWAETWEFQALLKARPIAGDAEVGQAYLDAVWPMVWTAVEREGFVESAQAMRRRVEEHVPLEQADRQIKLGPGGLRDVEFTVQLLQLVHGRADTSLRHRSTLEALRALRAAATLAAHKRPRWTAATANCACGNTACNCASWPHAPDARAMRRVCAFSPARRASRPWNTWTEVWADTQARVRAMHLEMFYRPLLGASPD